MTCVFHYNTIILSPPLLCSVKTKTSGLAEPNKSGCKICLLSSSSSSISRKKIVVVVNLKITRSSKFSNSREKAQYASKVQFYTIQPPQDTSDPSGNRLMLGLKDPKDDSFCEYERRPIATKAKKPRIEASHKDSSDRIVPAKKDSCSQVKQDYEPNGQLSNISVQDTKSVQQTVGEVKDEKDSIDFYNSPEPNEENSKAFMESIGSWINDFFNAPNKKPDLSSETGKENPQKESLLKKDDEYLKSISEIKEQFKKKLTRVTSVHVSGPEKPFDFNFDKVLDSSKKKRSSSLPPTDPPKWWEELSDLDNQVAETSEFMAQEQSLNKNATALLIRTAETEELRPKHLNSKNNLDLDSSNLIKKKRKLRGRNRSELDELEEYVFPTSAELSRKILLNVHDKEKCVTAYKNSHLGVQESQHYGQVKKKAYQHNARCYTTNANLTELTENTTSKPFSSSNRFSHCCTTDAAAMRGAAEILNKNSLGFRKSQSRKPSKKMVSELSRDSMTFLKMKSPKTLANVQTESAKGDAKSSSDELVKYLMKKIKTNHRPPQSKKKGSINVPQVLSSPKNRFMQSATNSLVMSVMAKHENPTKNGSRMHPDNKLYPGKELFAKYPESNIRFDVSRAVNQSKFSKCTYLLEGEKVEDDSYLLDKSSYKNTRRPFEDLLKRDSKKKSEKYNKRQEIKNMFSKLDLKFNVFQVPKVKPKEPKKKAAQTMPESFESEETKESQNGRFQKQHELFKTNLKMTEENLNPEPNSIINETGKETQICASNTSLLPAELAVIDTNLQLAPEEKNENSADQTNKTMEQTAGSPSVDCLGLDEKSNSLKTENKLLEKPKEKLFKPKAMQYLKDSESKMLPSPLSEYCHSENQNQKEIPKAHDAPLFPTDLRPVKPGETALLNRRFSTNSLLETAQKIKSGHLKNLQTSKTTLYLTDLEKKTDEDQKEIKDKKKVKSPGSDGTSSENPCEFESAVKKPAPNCEKEQP